MEKICCEFIRCHFWQTQQYIKTMLGPHQQHCIDAHKAVHITSPLIVSSNNFYNWNKLFGGERDGGFLLSRKNVSQPKKLDDVW